MIKKYVPIQLDKLRNMRLTYNELILIEDILKLKFQEILINASMMSIKECRALLYACLIHEDKTLTIEYTGELMQYLPLNVILDKLNECFINSLPPIDHEKNSQTPTEQV